MNREILFRGKRVDNGEWAEGDYSHDPDLETSYISGCDYYTDEDGLQRNFYGYEIIPETRGEYTGLTDKNGKKIFEGDIVSAHGYSGYVAMETDYWEIHWNHNFNRQLYLWHDVVEVIGNIYDNPEMLGGKEND